MRSSYSLLFLAIAATGTIHAQQVDRSRLYNSFAEPCPEHVSGTNPADAVSLRGGGVVWTEDFANGLAGNNPSGAWTTDGPNGTIWRVNTNAPRGAYTQNAERIASTTFANGFAKFASDSANCTWSGSTPTALPVSEFTDWEGSLVSPIIDLSATPFVELVFQQRSRFCCSNSPFYLDISTDGGISWPTSFLANEGLPINQGATGSGTPPTTTETRSFNITNAIAASPGTVQFRFHHDGTRGSSHYYWQIDDIQIANLPDNEIVMNYGYTSTTGLGEEYGRIPSSQLPSTMNVGAEVYNYGGQDQTNVVINCSVTDALGTEVFATSTSLGTIASGDTVVSDEDAVLPTLALGLYTATFTISSDQIDMDIDPSNNSKVRTFEVTDLIYSLDNLGNHPTGTQTATQVGSASFTDNSEDVKLLTMYFINDAYIATGLEIELGTNSDVGGRIIASILDTADVLSTPSVVNQTLAISDFYTLTQADITAGKVTIPFDQPITLLPNAYYAVASLFADGDNEVYVRDDTTVPQPGLASALWIPFDPDNNQNFYGGNGTAWAIRLTSNTSISVSESTELEGVTMYPNPTTGILRINSQGSQKFTAEVLNVLGELVLTTNFTGSTTLDLAEFADGVYSVRISNGANTTVQRITLN